MADNVRPLRPVQTPVCPVCSSVPNIILDDGHQCWCAQELCPVLFWDSFKTVAENLTHVSVIQPEEGIDG